MKSLQSERTTLSLAVWFWVVVAICAPLMALASPQSWDFAVTSKSKILFYDENWKEVTSSAHQFDELSALTFDESEETVYFNDQEHLNGSIFSLKIPISPDDPHTFENIIQRADNESVRGLAYDPLNRNLYWSDSLRKKIYFASLNVNLEATGPPKVLVDLSKEDSLPDGVAVDICRRKLYWTNSNFKNATVEIVDLNGSDRRILVSSDLYLPHGIVVDQLADRIYWVNDKQGVHFSVESARLDGSDRQIVVQGLNNVPFNLAVTKDAIYWTDLTHNAVWSHPKYQVEGNESVVEAHKVANFMEQVRGIVARTHFYQTLQNDQHCSKVVAKIAQRLLAPKVTRSPVDRQVEQLQREYCLNGGSYVPENGICICRLGYKGARCESSECHQFCVHGTCAISPVGFPKCYCQDGFYGERCQSSKCTGHCLNNGACKVDKVTGEPSCECHDNFGGPRCEQNSTEICALFCRILKHEPEAYAPFGCHDICEDLRREDGTDMYAIPRYQHLDVCLTPSLWTSNLIYALIAGVIICLGLIVLLVHGLRRIYKPARPRIKKTFVVRKQARTNSASDTPLTNRPLATEQCEITIENCCNMNICETPCFDPKLVEQTLNSRDTKVRVKEDKKILIHSMEDDLY